MRNLPLLIALGAFLFVVASTAQAQDCGANNPCPIGERSYHVRLPDDWDRKTPLPVLLHFHGWGRQGKSVINNDRIAGATRKQGVLLLAPNGLGNSWSIWGDSSRDVNFANALLANALLANAAKKWPIDRSRIFVSGYSWGGVMAWYYACAEGNKVHTLLGISGGFQDNEPEACATPVNIRHVHGLNDTVMRFPFGQYNEVEGAVSFWRKLNRCDDEKSSISNWKTPRGLPIERYNWLECESGKSVILDIHKRGHFIPRGWIAEQLRELL